MWMFIAKRLSSIKYKILFFLQYTWTFGQIWINSTVFWCTWRNCTGVAAPEPMSKCTVARKAATSVQMSVQLHTNDAAIQFYTWSTTFNYIRFVVFLQDITNTNFKAQTFEHLHLFFIYLLFVFLFCVFGVALLFVVFRTTVQSVAAWMTCWSSTGPCCLEQNQ